MLVCVLTTVAMALLGCSVPSPLLWLTGDDGVGGGSGGAELEVSHVLVGSCMRCLVVLIFKAGTATVLSLSDHTVCVSYVLSEPDASCQAALLMSCCLPVHLCLFAVAVAVGGSCSQSFSLKCVWGEGGGRGAGGRDFLSGLPLPVWCVVMHTRPWLLCVVMF